MSPSLHSTFAVQALADTVVAVQARGALATASDIAVIVLALSLAATFVALVLFLRRLAGLERRAVRAARQAMARTGPLLERSVDVADNLEFITQALRTDVERLNASVKALTDRLHKASDQMEERVDEFNALMEVVQSEAESIFIDTASTVRGVRAGARSLGGEDGSPPPPLPGGHGARTRETTREGGRGARAELRHPRPPGDGTNAAAAAPGDEPAAAGGEGPREPSQEADHAPS